MATRYIVSMSSMYLVTLASELQEATASLHAARCISLLSSLQSGGHCLKDNTRPCDQLTSPAFRHLCSSTGKLDQAEKFSIGFPVLIDKFLEMFLKWDEFKMRERNGCLEGVGCSINVTLMLPIYQKRNTGVSGSCCLYLVTRA